MNLQGDSRHTCGNRFQGIGASYDEGFEAGAGHIVEQGLARAERVQEELPAGRETLRS